MRALLSLFAKSPFSPLQNHMEKVSDCVHLLETLFEEIAEGNQGKAEVLAKEISKREHKADLAKTKIRDELSHSLFLPVDRSNFLEILTLQDSIADSAEDVAVLITFKQLPLIAGIREPFLAFLQKNFQAFNEVHKIIQELDEIVETSFGGIEAQRVRDMVEKVAQTEHETDLLQRTLLKALFAEEDKMSPATFFLWMKVTETLASISNLSENLANRVRRMLELKS